MLIKILEWSEEVGWSLRNDDLLRQCWKYDGDVKIVMVMLKMWWWCWDRDGDVEILVVMLRSWWWCWNCGGDGGIE